MGERGRPGDGRRVGGEFSPLLWEEPRAGCGAGLGSADQSAGFQMMA